MADFIIPSFLENHGPDELQAIGTKIMPDDIDMSEGGHPWNFTRAAALMVAELCEYVIPEAIRLFVPDYSYGTYLDDHATSRAMKRRAATAANGMITITGEAGSVIPAGSIFSTSSINNEPAVEYASSQEATIPDKGTIDVLVVCTQTGIAGNTAAATVIHVGSKIDGIISVTNEKAITGGTEEEDDESLIARIAEYDQALGDSFVGSPADYKRWAESVNGVGTASVIPAKDTSGLVTISLTDANGDPASQTICEEVYNHIMSPNDDNARLAPTGAYLSVIAPETAAIAIRAQVVLEDDATIESVIEEYMTRLQEYLPDAIRDEEIRYSRITRELSEVKGVYDYSDVQIGMATDGDIVYGTSNIAISDAMLPKITMGNMNITEAAV